MADEITSDTAVLEVKIGDMWVEWDRIEKKPGYVWDGLALSMMRPQTRVRYKKKPDTGREDER